MGLVNLLNVGDTKKKEMTLALGLHENDYPDSKLVYTHRFRVCINDTIK